MVDGNEDRWVIRQRTNQRTNQRTDESINEMEREYNGGPGPGARKANKEFGVTVGMRPTIEKHGLK